MNIFVPFLGVLLQSSSYILDKTILTLRKTGYRLYLGVSFPLSFLILLVFAFIFRPPFSWELLSGEWGLIILASALIGVIGNILYYRALEADLLSEIQMIDLLQGIALIVVSSLLFADERRYAILVPALVASAALVWSHWKNHHFHIAKKTLPYLAWALILTPVGMGLTKILLTRWDVLPMQLVRYAIFSLVLVPVFARRVHKVSARAFALLLLTNILSTIAVLFYFTSYQASGIVYTVLLFTLQPLIVYGASVLILKEPFETKKAIAFFVVLASIVAAKILP